MHVSNKCSVAVHCLIFIYEYGKKTKVTSNLLSLSSGCNPVTIRNILSALRKDGIIDVRFGTGGTTLICPPEDISLYRICMAVEPKALDKFIGIHSSPSRACLVGKNIQNVLNSSYEILRQDMITSMKSITLQKMLQDYHRIIE